MSLDESVKCANEGRFTEQVRISPKKGRTVFFDSRYYHASMHPIVNAQRIVVTFNFR